MHIQLSTRKPAQALSRCPNPDVIFDHVQPRLALRDQVRLSQTCVSFHIGTWKEVRPLEALAHEDQSTGVKGSIRFAVRYPKGISVQRWAAFIPKLASLHGLEEKELGRVLNLSGMVGNSVESTDVPLGGPTGLLGVLNIMGKASVKCPPERSAWIAQTLKEVIDKLRTCFPLAKISTLLHLVMDSATHLPLPHKCELWVHANDTFSEVGGGDTLVMSVLDEFFSRHLIGNLCAIAQGGSDQPLDQAIKTGMCKALSQRIAQWGKEKMRNPNRSDQMEEILSARVQQKLIDLLNNSAGLLLLCTRGQAMTAQEEASRRMLEVVFNVILLQVQSQPSLLPGMTTFLDQVIGNGLWPESERNKWLELARALAGISN